MKKFYKENRVFSILMIIVIICVILMLAVLFKSFFFGGSAYGDRLEDVEKYEVSDELKEEIVSSLESDEAIKEASVRVSVRTIYVKMEFNSGISLVEAQGKAVTVLEKFSEKQMGYYDIEFILNCESTDSFEGFTIMGAKNVNGTNIVWNNNTPVAQE